MKKLNLKNIIIHTVPSRFSEILSKRFQQKQILLNSILATSSEKVRKNVWGRRFFEISADFLRFEILSKRFQQKQILLNPILSTSSEKVRKNVWGRRFFFPLFVVFCSRNWKIWPLSRFFHVCHENFYQEHYFLYKFLYTTTDCISGVGRHVTF